MPFLGGLGITIAGTWATLAQGCALGLAVDKKSAELGLEHPAF